MTDIKELIARIGEGDDEAAAELEKVMAGKDQTIANVELLRERDKKVANDATFREKFPRAMAAHDKGRLTLPDDPSDEALLLALQGKEDELKDIGFEVPTPEEPAEAKVEEDKSGAAAWSGSPGPHSPADLHPDTAIHEIETAMTEPIASREWAEKLYRANREGDQSKIGDLREAYQPDAHPDSVVNR